MIQVMVIQPVPPSPGLQWLAAALHITATIPQSHYSPFWFSLLGCKPCVAWYGQCTDEVTPGSSKPLLPNWFATVGWFCPSWVPVVSVFHCFGLFNSFLLQAHFWEKQQVQGWVCREAVEGLVLSTCKQRGLRKRTEQEWPCTSLLAPEFCLAPGYPTMRDSWHRGDNLLPWFFSLFSLNGWWGF